MHHFPFHIGDWMSHTSHLSPEEKAAYLAMMIEEYLHEKPLPDDIEQIARKINMRSHCECIAVVLQEFYERNPDGEKGWSNKRVREEIIAYKEKSEKARNSANARWNKGKTGNNANAKRAQSERNANHKPITNNQSNTSTDKPADDLFDQFWSVYPRKESKKTAMTAWRKLSNIKKQKAINDARHRFDQTDRRYIPLPASYINAERWEDEQENKNNDPTEWAI